MRLARLNQNYWRTNTASAWGWDPPDDSSWHDSYELPTDSVDLRKYREGFTAENFRGFIKPNFKGWDTSHPDFSRTIFAMLESGMYDQLDYLTIRGGVNDNDTELLAMVGLDKAFANVGKRGVYLKPQSNYDVHFKIQGVGKVDLEFDEGGIELSSRRFELDMEMTILEKGRKVYVWKGRIPAEIYDIDSTSIEGFSDADAYIAWHMDRMSSP